MKKSKWIGACLVLFIFMAVFSFRMDRNAYRLDVIKVETGGYGYNIFQGERLMICQPFIPALSGKKAFVNAADARRVGELVLARLLSGADFSVSVRDLDSLGVSK